MEKRIGTEEIDPENIRQICLRCPYPDCTLSGPYARDCEHVKRRLHLRTKTRRRPKEPQPGERNYIIRERMYRNGVTAMELADSLQLSRKTVYAWLNHGEMEEKKVDILSNGILEIVRQRKNTGREAGAFSS